ncbi:HNH endonuclease [Yoonia sp.]|uniref:HNH endonuclease n=1 Tax=Yoonia sp. TaxID=2212373 RepID=UPI00391D7A37
MKKVKNVACRELMCAGLRCDGTDSRCIKDKMKVHKAPAVISEVSIRNNHQWYKQSRWKKIRLGQLSKQPLCQRCSSFDIVTAAVHVDHVIPHKGDSKLFYDAANLQSLCHGCHSVKTKAEQRGEILDYRTVSPF